VHKTGFIRSVKGKIIIAAILACFALFMAWRTSKDAFMAMLNAFENVSAPNEKLRIVNDLSQRITRLDQVQKVRILSEPGEYGSFFNETKTLNLEIDTLKHLYADQPAQVERLNTLKKLLRDRDKLFINYLKVREGLINNKSFSAQVESLNEIVDKTSKQADSTVTTTEKKTSTTTVYPTPTATTTTEEQPRGFFNKLFGGKKKQKKTDSSDAQPYQIVNEELHVKRDTIALAIQDSLLKDLGETMHNMEKIQQRKSALFVNRETVLIKSSANVIRQIVAILKKVETEVVAQTAINNVIARDVVNNSIKRISLIMLAFLTLTILMLYFILKDISRINKYRKELELAKDEAEYHALAKHRFLSNMSHEIRTPLQSIIGYAEMVKQQAHPQKKDIEAIYRSSGHLMQIVNEVLDYNRIISGKFSFANQVFNMQGLLDEVISVMKLQAEKKAINLETVYDENVPVFLSGDPFRLKQVLYNLLGNAIKFTQEGEVRLTVIGKPDNNDVRYSFEVSDTGIGLSASELEHIFNEFEQAGDEKQAHEGTGLGLPITKELIESQGGNIKVRSKEGKGSNFTFELTFTKAEQPVINDEKTSQQSASVNTDKVWIIDDDPFILELCSRMFDNNKIEYRCFTSPHEILNTPWDDDVKYLLLDIRMPGMNGMELCRELRKQVPEFVKIYALTAQAMPGEREIILKQGFNGVLMKPFRESELVALIKGGQDTNGIDLPRIDIRAIEKMTFGDPEQTAKILVRFAADSLNDIKELKDTIDELNTDKVILLTHRIAGRTAQAGARGLAESFRLAEMELDRDKELTRNRIMNILALADKLHDLAMATQEYTYKEPVL